MNLGDIVFIDPGKVKANRPGRQGELKDFFHCRYRVTYIIDDALLMGLPEDSGEFYPHPIVLEKAVLSYA